MDEGPIFFQERPLDRRGSLPRDPGTRADAPQPGRGNARRIQQAVGSLRGALSSCTDSPTATGQRAAGGGGARRAVHVCGILPERRLPMRAYHCAVIIGRMACRWAKSRPLSLFERMEVGFNIYYTFREGESAWLYTGMLRLFAN